MGKEKISILRKEVYDIPTPSSLTIGDGSYLEQIASKPKRETRNLRELVFMDDSIPAVRRAKLIFKEVLIEFEETKALFPDGMRQFEVSLIVSNREYINTFVDGKYFPNAVKAHKELGCDVASFDIIAGYPDGVRDDTIQTGSDGFYGDVLVNKVPFGFVANLYLDADYVCERQVKASLAYLFKCEELGICDNTVCQLSLSSEGKTREARLQIPYKTDMDNVRRILTLEDSETGSHMEPDRLLDFVCRRYNWRWIKTELSNGQDLVLELN